MAETDYKHSRGYSRLLEFYEDLMGYGWKFYNNFPFLESARKRKMCFLGDGLEVFIGPVTFDASGRAQTRAVPLFTREKKK